MLYGNVEPSSLPTANAIRVMKSKTLQKENLADDPIISTVLLKKDPPFNQIIRDIGYDTFFLHYWATTEINTYRIYTRKNKVPRITIDATGGVEKKIDLINGRRSSHIFLYQIGVMDYANKLQYSVAHMLSERHDNHAISFWLARWAIGNKLVLPKIAVCDQSLAIMMAMTKVFTQYSTLNAYLNACSSILLNKNKAELPYCMIRNDFNHLMHLISSWPELRSLRYRIKNLYLRSLGLVIVSTSFMDIKDLLQHIFTVALNEEDGLNEDKEPNLCEISKSVLKQRIATHEIELLENEENENDSENLEVDDEEDTNLLQNDVFMEIKGIYEDCVRHANKEAGDHDNTHYCPAIAKRILNFCKLLPVWSAVMIPYFGYGNTTESSATSESLFNDLKNRIFGHIVLPIRLDRFLKIHCNAILGAMNIIRANNAYKDEADKEKSVSPYSPDDNPTEIQVKSLQENELECQFSPIVDDPEEMEELKSVPESTVFENWKGLATEELYKHKKFNLKTDKEDTYGRTAATRSYVEKDPSILYYKDESKAKCRIIGILRNGNNSNLKSLKIGKNHYTFLNTCTFDSIIHLLYTAYVDSENYASFLKENESELLFKLIINAVLDGINVQTYKKRAQILYELSVNYQFRTRSLTGNHFQIDTSCTATFLIKTLFQNFPSYTVRERCCSVSCGQELETAEAIILVNFEKNENLSALENVLKRLFSKARERRCIKCDNKTTNVVYEFKKHIFLEIAFHLTKKQLNSGQVESVINLEDLKATISVNNEKFYLKGIISFIPPCSQDKNAVGHYVTYSWRGNWWEKYDDLLQTFHRVNVTKNVSTQFLFYTV